MYPFPSNAPRLRSDPGPFLSVRCWRSHTGWSGYGERSISSGKFGLPSFWTSAIPFAASPNIQDIDIAILIRGRFAGASHVSGDRLSIDLGTESMPELGPGTKRRVSVMRAPPWSAVLWQHLRELVRGIAEQGSDHHRDNEQDQRVGERGRDQEFCNGPARRMAGAASTPKRSVTVDVGRYHGQQIDRGTMTKKKTVTPTTIAGPDRSQTRDRDVDDDQQNDPCDQRTIGIADDRLNECIGVGAAVEEAPQPMKPAHTRTNPLKGPSARNAQMPPRTAILKERAINCVLCGGAALRMTCIVAVLSLQGQI